MLAWKPGDKTFQMLPGTELSANNGIETSPDDREFYVVSTTTKRVIAYSRDKPGAALRTAQLKEFGPDNVRWTADNRLITAGMLDNEPACGGAPKTEEGIRCPRGYVVVTIDPKTMAVTEIARGPATPSFTGTAIAHAGGQRALARIVLRRSNRVSLAEAMITTHRGTETQSNPFWLLSVPRCLGVSCSSGG